MNMLKKILLVGLVSCGMVAGAHAAAAIDAVRLGQIVLQIWDNVQVQDTLWAEHPEVKIPITVTRDSPLYALNYNAGYAQSIFFNDRLRARGLDVTTDVPVLEIAREEIRIIAELAPRLQGLEFPSYPMGGGQRLPAGVFNDELTVGFQALVQNAAQLDVAASARIDTRMKYMSR